MLNLFRMFTLMKNNKKGQGMVEYGLIIGLVAVVVIAGLMLLGPTLSELFKDIDTKLNTVTVP